MPSFLDFMCYLNFCGAAISGPWYEFKDFQKYMRSQDQYANIPQTYTATLKRVLNIFALIAFSIFWGQYFDEKFYMTKEFEQMPFTTKFGFMIAVIFNIMSIYVIGFCFMETGIIASGLSYNGTDEHGNAKHDKI
jgi:D-alanyl-lipoteichoic acid acyltransferase DltB (MBOAT superfamily)